MYTNFLNRAKKYFTIFAVIYVSISLLVMYLYPEKSIIVEYDGSVCAIEKMCNLSFVDSMKSISWSLYKRAVISQNVPEIKRHSTKLLLKLINFLIRHPTVPVNQSCISPLFEMPIIPDQLLLCKPVNQQSPRKVGIIWQFGFDVDALEIHLHELYNLVDRFFILESIKAHSSYISSKPLMWELLKHDKRFAKFSEKIVHFIVDDAWVSKVDTKNIWSKESQQELLRWTKFLEWNNATKYFGPDDLLGFGDVDEVPNRDDVMFLKNCQIDTNSTDIGIWFPFDGINTVFSSDYPVKGHRYTLGDPTFWTLSSAMEYHKSSGLPPSRMRGNSSGFLLGGMHLSRYAYPPFQMVKLLTATESSTGSLKTLIKVGQLFAEGKIEKAEKKLNLLPSRFKNFRVRSLEYLRNLNMLETEAVVKLPWFLKCNRERYPGLTKDHDFRLDALKDEVAL